jgi:hypothetical protein
MGCVWKRGEVLLELDVLLALLCGVQLAFDVLCLSAHGCLIGL